MLELTPFNLRDTDMRYAHTTIKNAAFLAILGIDFRDVLHFIQFFLRGFISFAKGVGVGESKQKK